MPRPRLRAALATICLTAAAPLAAVRRPLASPHAHHPEPLAAAAPARDADDRRFDLDYLDDRGIRQHIEREGTKLIEAGQTVSNDRLQAQLQDQRQLAEPAPPPGVLVHSARGVYDQAQDSVLVVAGLYLCDRCDNYHANCASGFVVRDDGLAVTNHHVVESDNNITLVAMTRDGRVVPIVEVLASNEDDDVALVRLGGDGFAAAPLARSARVGQRVHAITHPNGQFFYYSSGEIARFARVGRQRTPRIQITADYAKGSSGGPIFNDAGQVVAMVTSTNSVYYNSVDGDPRNLQMVVRNCVPYEAALELFAEPGHTDPHAQDRP